jgi:hypothetical protein
MGFGGREVEHFPLPVSGSLWYFLCSIDAEPLTFLRFSIVAVQQEWAMGVGEKLYVSGSCSPRSPAFPFEKDRVEGVLLSVSYREGGSVISDALSRHSENAKRT